MKIIKIVRWIRGKTHGDAGIRKGRFLTSRGIGINYTAGNKLRYYQDPLRSTLRYFHGTYNRGTRTGKFIIARFATRGKMDNAGLSLHSSRTLRDNRYRGLRNLGYVAANRCRSRKTPSRVARYSDR